MAPKRSLNKACPRVAATLSGGLVEQAAEPGEARMEGADGRVEGGELGATPPLALAGPPASTTLRTSSQTAQ
jgi:hypothetical protein